MKKWWSDHRDFGVNLAAAMGFISATALITAILSFAIVGIAFVFGNTTDHCQIIQLDK